MSTCDTSSITDPNARGIRRVEFHALGTHCIIQFRHPDTKSSLMFVASALDWLENFESTFSRFRPNSDISRINQAAGGDWIKVGTGTEKIFDLAATLHSLTDGILDPTMLPLLKVWDWKTNHSKLPDHAEIRAALALTGFTKIQRRPGEIRLPLHGMGLDFGGFGKEYAVDQLVHIARLYGIQDALIDLGRDIYGMGGNGQHPFWHVGIEDGLNPGTCRGGLAVSNFAVAASGDYARRFEFNGKRYGHILDPRTGWPVSNGLRAVTVIAPTCLQAGIYSTALFVLGTKEGLRFAACARGVEAAIQSDQGIETTPNFVRSQIQAA